MNSRQRYRDTYGLDPDTDAFTRHIERTYGPPLPPPRELIDDPHTARTGEADRQRLDLRKSDEARRRFQWKARTLRRVLTVIRWMSLAAYAVGIVGFCALLGWAAANVFVIGAGR